MYVNQLGVDNFYQCFCLSRNDVINSVSLLIVFLHVFNMSSAVAVVLINSVIKCFLYLSLYRGRYWHWSGC